MVTLERTRLPETSKVARKPRKASGTEIASALAGTPIPLPRITILDVVVEERILDPDMVLPFLSGYQKPPVAEVIKALRAGPGLTSKAGRGRIAAWHETS